MTEHTPQAFDFANSMPQSVEQTTLAVLERIERLLIARFHPVATPELVTLEVKPESRAEQVAKLAQKTMGRRR